MNKNKKRKKALKMATSRLDEIRNSINYMSWCGLSHAQKSGITEFLKHQIDETTRAIEVLLKDSNEDKIPF